MPMNYTTLVADKDTVGSIASWVNYSRLDTATVLAEAQTLIYQTLRVREMRVSGSITLVNGDSSAPLPNATDGDFLEPIVLRDNDNSITLIPNDERFLSQEKLTEVRAYTGGTLNSGVPGYVSIFDEAFQFDVRSNATWTAQVIYFQRPDLLSSSNQTNWLTNRYPHILRTACMAAAADFMKDNDEYAKSIARLQQLIEVANRETTNTTGSGVSAAVNNKPELEGSLLYFLDPGTVPVQSILAEAQALIFNKLRTREMRASETVTLGIGLNFVALPNASSGRFLEVISLHDDTNSATMIPNDNAFVSEQRLLAIRTASAGVPTHVSIFNEAFQFDRPASGSTSYTLVYYLRPANLTNRTQTSWLTLRYPQILRVAAQAALADFNRDGAAHTEALKRLDELIKAANAEASLPEAAGIVSGINKPAIEGSLLSFIADTTVPVQAILAESQALIFSKLRAREMRISSTVTLTAGSSSVALPDASTGQFLEMVALRDDTNSRSFIPSDEHFVSEQRLLTLRQYSGGVLSTGTPAYVAIFNEALNFNVKATSNVTFSIIYYQRPTALTSASQSNWLTLRYPQIFRTAAQAALADFKQDSAAHAAALQRLDILITQANAEALALDAKGVASDVNTAAFDSSLLSFISDTQVPVQAVLAEAQALIYSKLRVREMRASTTFSLTVGVNNVALPGASAGNFLEPITLHDDTNSITLIPSDDKFVSEQRLLTIRSASNAVPSQVAIFNEAFQFGCPANGTINYTLVFYQRPTFLTSPSSSNWLSLRYPQILRTATQVAIANFKHDAAGRSAAMQTLDALIDVANKEDALTVMRGTKSDLTAPAVDSTLLNFIADTTVPAQAILAEAQALIFAKLRAREMRISTTVTLSAGSSSATIPDTSTGRFLEIIAFRDDTNSVNFIPNDERFVSEQRLLSLRTYTAGVLATGTPAYVALFNEAFNFDVKATATTTFSLVYYQRPTALTAPSQSNWLTLRYPQIFRTATQAALADFKHDAEANKAALQRLDELIAAANAENIAVDAKGVASDINKAPLDSSLISFIANSQVPVQAILAESQALIFSKLRAREMRISTTLTLTAGSSSVTIPDTSTGRFLEIIALHDDTNAHALIPSDSAFVSEQRLLGIREYTGGVLNTGTPAYVSIYNESFNFDVKASTNITLSLIYYQRPAALTSPSQSNWLTLRYPQIFRTAAQAALADYKQDSAAHVAALQRLDELIKVANEEANALDAKGVASGLNKAAVDSSLISFISSDQSPVQAVLSEAQQLLYSTLRTREMTKRHVFTMEIGESSTALPERFLDPIGRMYAPTLNLQFRHKDIATVNEARIYNTTSGNFASNPFATTNGSTDVNVTLAAHSFNQGSTINIAGATSVGGLLLNDTFDVTSITSSSVFVIDATLVGTATSTATGGGSSATYTANILQQGMPVYWAIWDERIEFDLAFVQQMAITLNYFQSLPLLTSEGQNNFLTTRYSQLFRMACQAADANMRRDRAGYQSIVTTLMPLINKVNADNEGHFRSLELDTETP